MSFLTRDVLEDGGEKVPMIPSRSNGSSRPTTASGFGGRMMSGSEVSSLSPNSEACYGAEDLKTPTSQVNMREKMLQQRQKILAQKQRQSVPGAGSMVTANASTPSDFDRVPTPMGNTRPIAKSPTGGLAGQFGTGPNRTFNSTVSSANFCQEETNDILGDDEDRVEKNTMVLPVMTAEMKEEEAKRRQTLNQQLADKGITPMYDPLEGAAPENRATFDCATVATHDMRSFLHNPFPKNGGMLQCRIVRDRSGITNKLQPKYYIESDAGVFLMAAQKQSHNKTPNYAISMARGSIQKGTDAFLGKLRSDVCGLQWLAYGPGLNPTKADTKQKSADAPAIQLVRDELVAVQYSASFWGTKPKGPRKMTMTIPRVQPNGERLVCRTLTPQTDGLLALAGNQSQLVESYSNKSPKWNDTIGAYVLNFNKRVTEASVKNFQLVSSSDPDTVYLQFGKVGKDAFNVDFRHPLSAFQAFSICLTSFEYKLGCE